MIRENIFDVFRQMAPVMPLSDSQCEEIRRLVEGAGAMGAYDIAQIVSAAKKEMQIA